MTQSKSTDILPLTFELFSFLGESIASTVETGLQFYFPEMRKHTIQNAEKLSHKDYLKAIKDVSASKTSLNLNNPLLHYKNQEELTQIFAAIPAHIKALCLSGSGLAKSAACIKNLTQACHQLPQGITHIDLKFNDFASSSINELLSLAKSLPCNLTHLDVTSNNLGQRTDKELIQFIKAAPASLNSIVLSGAFELNNRSNDEIECLLCSLPSKIKHITMRGKRYDMNIFMTTIYNKYLNSMQALEISCTKNLISKNDSTLPALLSEVRALRSKQTFYLLTKVLTKTVDFLEGKLSHNDYQHFATTITQGQSSPGWQRLGCLMAALGALVVAVGVFGLITTGTGTLISVAGVSLAVSGYLFFEHGRATGLSKCIHDVLEVHPSGAASVSM